MKKHLFYTAITISLIILPVLSALGQPPPPPPQDIPIDGGLIALIAAGVGYAIKLMFFKKNKKDQQ